MSIICINRKSQKTIPKVKTKYKSCTLRSSLHLNPAQDGINYYSLLFFLLVLLEKISIENCIIITLYNSTFQQLG